MGKISEACLQDVSELNTLVNSAYRGKSSMAGWTHEASLLEGIRIDEEQLIDMVTSDNNFLLKYVEGERILGCVLLEKRDAKLYLGMLTVNPMLQNKGIGKTLLSAAEEKAMQTDCKKIEMTVISVRHELIDWYKRKGYEDTGIRKPFPAENTKWGTPKTPLEFIVMEKELQRQHR